MIQESLTFELFLLILSSYGHMSLLYPPKKKCVQCRFIHIFNPFYIKSIFLEFFHKMLSWFQLTLSTRMSSFLAK